MQLKLLIVTMKYNFPGVKFAHKKTDKEFNKYHRLVHTSYSKIFGHWEFSVITNSKKRIVQPIGLKFSLKLFLTVGIFAIYTTLNHCYYSDGIKRNLPMQCNAMILTVPDMKDYV